MSTHLAGGPVVVGVDGSDSAFQAVRWGAREARRRGVHLRLVNAFGWSDVEGVAEMFLTSEYREALMAAVQEHVASAAAVADETAPGLAVEREVVGGYPVGVLRAESERACLLVLGSRGHGGVAGLLLGSVSASLAGQAACPIVIIRGVDVSGPSSERPVVVGVDGTASSEAALAFAYDAAASRSVPLVAVHTWRDLVVDPSIASLVDWDAVEVEEQEVLAERLAGWTEKYPDVPIERVVARGRPAAALLERAADAQLVVVGSRGRGQLASTVLGSVSHALLHRSVCPVAVVRPVDDERE